MREGWKEVNFGDVVQFPPKISMKKGTIYPFIPMEALASGKKYVKPKEEKALTSGGAKFEEGDTLFARITPCLQNGKISQAKNLNGKPGFGSTEYFIFRGKEGITDTDFIYYLTLNNWFKDKAIGSMVGASGRQRADTNFVRNIEIELPSLHSQRKIASILSSYDDLIENNLKRIKLLEEKAQLTYEEWFIKMRFPGYETAKFDAITGLTEGWEKKMLSEISHYIGRGISPKYVEEDGFSIINQKCIRDNRVDKSFCRLTDTSKKILQDKVLQSFDILINSTGTGTLGRVAQILTVNELLTVDTHVTIVRAGENISKIFLGRSLEYNQERIEKFGKGATNQIELSRHDLGELIVIDLPTLELQNLYEIKCKPNYQVIDKLIVQNRLLKEARDILLPRLMSGMIDVDEVQMETLQTAE